jgi:hypothetical protein
MASRPRRRRFCSLTTPETVNSVAPAAIDRTNPISWSCCFVVPRAVWDNLGGFDERFKGWGWEDMAFQSVVCGLYGHERLDGDVWHLWHPRAEERIRRGTPLHPAYVANRMLGRRYMWALRVLGMHDRATPSDDEEMERDRQNVRRLAEVEELDGLGRPRPGLPDWREWWPTLEELRDGAKAAARQGPRRGSRSSCGPAGRSRRGRPAASTSSARWRRSRSTSGTSRRSPGWCSTTGRRRCATELEAIAERHGFYVVGEGNRGFTRAMVALWRYLGTRSWPYDYALLTEDDFVFERDVELGPMIRTLAENDHLVQVALLRGAFYQAERDAGGILGHPIEEFEAAGDDAVGWLEHRRFFTLNPTVVRRSLFGTRWPVAEHSEAVFGRQLFADKAARSALWGHGETWVRHLGEVRAGAGY